MKKAPTETFNNAKSIPIIWVNLQPLPHCEKCPFAFDWEDKNIAER